MITASVDKRLIYWHYSVGLSNKYFFSFFATLRSLQADRTATVLRLYQGLL